MKILAKNKKINNTELSTQVKNESHHVSNYVSNPNIDACSQSIKPLEKKQNSEILSTWQDEQTIADFRW